VGGGVPFLKMHKGRANSSERARGGRILSSGRGNIISSLFQLEWDLFFLFLTQSTLRKGLYHGEVLSENTLKGLIHISESNSCFSLDVAFFLFLYLERIFVFSPFQLFSFLYIRLLS